MPRRPKMEPLFVNRGGRTTIYGEARGKRRQMTVHLPSTTTALGALSGRIWYPRELRSGDRVDTDKGTLTSRYGKVERIFVDMAGKRAENIRSFFVWPPGLNVWRLESTYARYLERSERFLKQVYIPIFEQVAAAPQVRIRCAKSTNPCGEKNCFWELKDDDGADRRSVYFRAHEKKPKGTKEVRPELHHAFYRAQGRIARHNETLSAMRHILGVLLEKELSPAETDDQLGKVTVNGRLYMFRSQQDRWGRFFWSLIFWPRTLREVVVDVGAGGSQEKSA